MNKTQYKNALEWINSLPEDIQEICWERLLDQPQRDLVEQILELTSPEDWQALVVESTIDAKFTTEGRSCE